MLNTNDTTRKVIKFQRATRDYAAYLDGQYIGSFDRHHEAMVELDRLVSEQARHS